ncbi:hypothetical protein DUNSADRAFT_10516 [Dunaliella salina]|nr:hypothetical protein DUNSADRAFT_10516 [Dunaliella salina]|eukprot:KAF5833235.1 hypothetical protein DUNSADRAFT_10516 [Dunaliella salina]
MCTHLPVRKKGGVRLLGWPAESTETVVVSSAAGPLSIGHKEPAGHLFHTAILKQHGLFQYPPEEDEEDKGSNKSGSSGGDKQEKSTGAGLDDQPPPGVNWKGSKKKKTKGKKEGQDLYLLLGLQNERFMATDNQIKNAYRRACLEHHPDKKLTQSESPEEKQRVEDHFKLIQEAHSVLSDPAKRREYDSTDHFDDSLPLECDPADFFKVFGPAFRRNARWSVDPKVPDVGDEKTPYDQVEKFYNFWFGFKSWREFPHPDEEDTEGCESREHKRWLDRQNAKLREKGKKEESKRLKEFINAAYSMDPRVIQKKENDRLERERKKQAKEDAKRRAVEEAEAKVAAENAARQAAEEAEKKRNAEAKAVREAEKNTYKKERQRLRRL